METLRELLQLLEDKYYTGKPLESGGTSIAGSAAPALKALVGKVFKPGMKVLDYGAGKYARNADHLRKDGIETFAYDPFNGNAEAAEGWDEGKISKSISLKVNGGKKFDAGFSCFVLNVVPKNVEQDIIKEFFRASKPALKERVKFSAVPVTSCLLLEVDEIQSFL